jgi:uncharacterized protein YdhG (YjbR/CyaY superfamily)
MKTVTTIEEYVNLFPAEQRAALEKIRKTIKEAAPKAEEYVGYGMAGYKLNGVLVYFGGFKNHCSFFPAGYSVIKKFSSELKQYKTSKGTIQFPLDQPVPTALIRKMVQERVKENELKAKVKTEVSKKKTKANH